MRQIRNTLNAQYMVLLRVKGNVRLSLALNLLNEYRHFFVCKAVTWDTSVMLESVFSRRALLKTLRDPTSNQSLALRS